MSELFGVERPKMVETIVLGGGAIGDRSENGDYIYGRSGCARSTGGCRISRRS